MKFEEQSFIVVGGARLGGIGLHFVKQLLSIGVEKIAVFDIIDSSDAVGELKVQFPDKTVSFHKVDVRNRGEIESAFEEVISRFGCVDVLTNFAAIMNESNIKFTLDVNLLGTMYGTMVGIDHMSIENGGRGGMIVNCASIAGIDPFSATPVYCGTKFGVIGFTRSLAEKQLEHEMGIRFVILCPGITETQLMNQSMGTELFRTEGKEEISKLIEKYGMQTAEQCGSVAVQALKVSENGSAWILDQGNYKSINFPLHFKRE